MSAGVLRAQPLSLRRVPRRDWIQRATLLDFERATRTHARTHSRLPVRERMPLVCRAGRRSERKNKGRGACDPWTLVRLNPCQGFEDMESK
jgi:hypothetical protein